MSMLRNLPFKGDYPVSQRFGDSPEMFGKLSFKGVPLRGHPGLDFELPIGTPIVAVQHGVVLDVRDDPEGYGKSVLLGHRWGQTFYAHLQEVKVERNQQAAAGQPLGLSGDSGLCPGPTFHFGLRIIPYSLDDSWCGFTDPLPYLARLVQPRGAIIGPHIIASIRPHLELLARWRPRLITVLDPNPDDLLALRDVCPDSIVVARIYVPDHEMSTRIRTNPEEAAQWAHEITQTRMAYGVDYWQIANEVHQDPDGLPLLNQFELARMQLADDAGYRCAIMGFSVGNPDLPENDRMAVWQHVYPALEYAESSGHIVALHQYGMPDLWGPNNAYDWYIYRLEHQVLRRLPFRQLKFAVTEYGIDGMIRGDQPSGWQKFTTPEGYVEQLLKCGRYLERFSGQVLGYSIFTLGHYNPWQSYDIAGKTAAYLADLSEKGTWREIDTQVYDIIPRDSDTSADPGPTITEAAAALLPTIPSTPTGPADDLDTPPSTPPPSTQAPSTQADDAEPQWEAETTAFRDDADTAATADEPFATAGRTEEANSAVTAEAAELPAESDPLTQAAWAISAALAADDDDDTPADALADDTAPADDDTLRAAEAAADEAATAALTPPPAAAPDAGEPMPTPDYSQTSAVLETPATPVPAINTNGVEGHETPIPPTQDPNAAEPTFVPHVPAVTDGNGTAHHHDVRDLGKPVSSDPVTAPPAADALCEDPAEPAPTEPSEPPAPTEPPAPARPLVEQRIALPFAAYNMAIKHIQERPDNPLDGESPLVSTPSDVDDVVYLVKDIFMTYYGSWEPSGEYESVPDWARADYLRPSFLEAGADHHLFAAVIGLDGELRKGHEIVYWSDGYDRLNDPGYMDYVRERTKDSSGWANLFMAGGSSYVPQRGETGPWCWAPAGAAEVVVGGGLPVGHPVSTFVVWQAVPRAAWEATLTVPTPVTPAPEPPPVTPPAPTEPVAPPTTPPSYEVQRRISEWIPFYNVGIKPLLARPDRPQGDVIYVVKDVFTTRNGSWEPIALPGSVPQWARDSYLKPLGAPDYFDDAGGDHHLFAAVIGLDGQLVRGQEFIYWSDGFEQLGNADYQGYVRRLSKERSGWANIITGPGSSFVPERNESGPWCWAPVGAAEVVVGGGLPANHHISFFVVWQAIPNPNAGGTTPDDDQDHNAFLPTVPSSTSIAPADAGAAPNLDLGSLWVQMLRQSAWTRLGLELNVDSALAAYARRANLGMPVTNEFEINGYRVQGYSNGIAYLPVGQPQRAAHVPW